MLLFIFRVIIDDNIVHLVVKTEKSEHEIFQAS